VPEHRTLLKFIGSCEVGATGFEPYCGMIVTELVEYGSLGDIVHNVLRSISFRLYLRIATDIATALAYLHDGGFVHGALRPSNVMLLSLSARAECVAKLQDYGAAPHERLSAMQARADRGGGGGDQVRSLQPEIMLYAAPEALADPPHYNAASDVFAFGLVLFESFARQLPYLGADSPYDVTVAKREGTAPGTSLPGAPEALARLIASCLAPRPRKRAPLQRVSEDLAKLVAATESGSIVVDPMLPNDRTTVDVTTAYRSLNDQEPVRTAPEHVLLAESDLTVSDVIGRGAFGDVYQGLWRKTVPVAIKTMRSDLTTPEDLNELLAEANLLMSLPAHPCIVIVYGICQPSSLNGLWLIMELLENGSLLRLLRSAPHNGGEQSSIGVVEMVGISQDIVSGMLHLQSNGIIHRDLAARNVLIGARTQSGYRAKVSDFGLSRQGHAYYFNPNDQKKRPVKWTAPEALAFNRYSAASDVWSFGVVLWEMSSHGMDPYPTMTVQEVFAAVQRGYRLERPPSCPDFLGDLMHGVLGERSARATDVEQSARQPVRFVRGRRACAVGGEPDVGEPRRSARRLRAVASCVARPRRRRA
jgi:fyn-related kinase